MLCAEKLKSKDNLSLARAPAKLGKKSMSIILIQNNSSLFILGQNRIIKYVFSNKLTPANNQIKIN